MNDGPGDQRTPDKVFVSGWDAEVIEARREGGRPVMMSWQAAARLCVLARTGFDQPWACAECGPYVVVNQGRVACARCGIDAPAYLADDSELP